MCLGLHGHPVAALPSGDQNTPGAAAVGVADQFKRFDAIGIEVVIWVEANIQDRDIEPVDAQGVSHLPQARTDEDLGRTRPARGA